MRRLLPALVCLLAALLALLRPAAALEPAPGTSRLLYPAQTIPLRFDHRAHVAKVGLGCTFCHAEARTSRAAEDNLLPGGAVCDLCHESRHDDRAHVEPGPDDAGACATCHAGHRPEDGNRVARSVVPTARIRFDHRAHAVRGLPCAQCHGRMDAAGLATEAALPSMTACVGCHAAEAAGERGGCAMCHGRRTDGRIPTRFPEGDLRPPAWLRHAEHTADFVTRHQAVAAEDSRFCAACHTERFCTDCHDGRVRPRSVHPGDWLSVHPIAARQDVPTCTSCHHQQSFCLDCHLRAGVARTSTAFEGRRFHPAGWVNLGGARGRGSHAWEAQRNLSGCVSCHTERDCAACHASPGRRGLGIDPHPPGFAARCRTQLGKNARPCLVCHESDAAELARCQ